MRNLSTAKNLKPRWRSWRELAVFALMCKGLCSLMKGGYKKRKSQWQILESRFLLDKREVTIMKIGRHPNIVRLHEVLASRRNIYIILEHVSGGDLFDKILAVGFKSRFLQAPLLVN